jgi:4'-phosphopantetheinyl transferase EntD
MVFAARFWEEESRAKLGLPVLISVAQEPVAPEALDLREREAYARLQGSPRLECWLRGRMALRNLLSRLDENTGPGTLCFPHKVISLSHSGPYAVAAGVKSRATSGLGVDLELSRTPKSGSERFFLNAQEQIWILTALPITRPRELLRLWTVKEALFKANPHNRDSLLGHYGLIDPEALAGQASWRGDESIRYRYGTLALDDGFLSIAFRT